jgi:NAD(P)-dependent dehydrogenase (short-subunit alcohol dehydrogenase family)
MSTMSTYSPDLVPHRWRGRVAVVTGANSGIGFEVARALACGGAKTVLACRSGKRGTTARSAILDRHPFADVELLRLDLADLSQIAEAAAEAIERFGVIDLCVNNAGLINRSRSQTVDGFESTFAVNHLGHFAWTAHLLPALLAGSASRVVTVSSIAHLQTSMDWSDLQGLHDFRPVTAYRRSKLANLLHSFELHRRLLASKLPAASNALAVAAHPGIAASSFWENAVGPRLKLAARAFDICIASIFSTATQGASPILYAATEGGVVGGRFYGPRIAQRWGRPGPVEPSLEACDPVAARRLWIASEELTGITVAL